MPSPLVLLRHSPSYCYITYSSCLLRMPVWVFSFSFWNFPWRPENLLACKKSIGGQSSSKNHLAEIDKGEVNNQCGLPYFFAFLLASFVLFLFAATAVSFFFETSFSSTYLLLQLILIVTISSSNTVYVQFSYSLTVFDFLFIWSLEKNSFPFFYLELFFFFLSLFQLFDYYHY